MDTPLRVVVADNDPDMRHFLWHSLTHEGHRVIAIAENGRQLVDGCVLHRPDLLITEVDLPELDGLDAIREVCSHQTVFAIVISTLFSGTSFFKGFCDARIKSQQP